MSSRCFRILTVFSCLEPSNSDRETVDAYFHHLGHSFMTNCTIKNDKQIRDAHDAITSDTLFDNYMYDMMTRNQWTGLNL
uniref:Uncharacterized protein n=1 Tax=Caenorhabditis japonica TaxID=281687 RepID=A0A8R1ECK8_CAEJA